MIKIWPLLVAVCITGTLIAQDAEVVFKAAQQKGESVEFTYDLNGVVPGQTFEVRILIKVNGEEQELKQVSGEVGKNITAGKDKTITWYAKKELLEFKGDIKPMIKANVVFTPLYKAEILGGKSLKRGKTYAITWTGGVKDQPVNVELIKGDRPVATLKNNLPNNGKANITISKNMSTGSNYRIRILNVLNPTNKSDTEKMRISRSFPIGVAVLGAAIVVGGVIYFLLSGEDDPDPPDEEPKELLPDAPGTPD